MHETLKYFTFDYKGSTNFGKFYFLSKIHKRLNNFSGRPVMSAASHPGPK